MAAQWRSGADRMLERVVISRRTSEQELDLLMLLEEDAPAGERVRQIEPAVPAEIQQGEATSGEIAIAISEWLTTIKDAVQGHDKFQLAVARNALGMIARDDALAGGRADARAPHNSDFELAQAILDGSKTLASEGLLAELKQAALEKLTVDVPKYPALKAARESWVGEK
jgi:hypothetical protein